MVLMGQYAKHLMLLLIVVVLFQVYLIGIIKRGRKAAQLKANALDVVICWVNGSDPVHRRHVEQIVKQEGYDEMDNLVERYTEWGTLRFALRSVEKNMPFVRHVYLVTDGQVPSWWDKYNSWASIVTHDEIFVEVNEKTKERKHLQGVLPTFNSNAIELNLHNIPGLSKRFIYFNDDMFA